MKKKYVIGLLIVVQLIQGAACGAFVEIYDSNKVMRKVISHLRISKTTKAPLNQKAAGAGQPRRVAGQRNGYFDQKHHQ